MSIMNPMMQSYEEAFQAVDITSEPMRKALTLWRHLYFDKTRTKDSDPCQQIPYTIIRKLTKATFAEYQATGKDDFAQLILDGISAEKRKTAMQKSLMLGRAYIKPIPTKDGFRFPIVSRDNMMVFGAEDGEFTDIGTREVTATQQYIYTLLERRTVVDGYLTIRNALYRSKEPGIIGARCPLGELPKYRELMDEYTFPIPVGSIGMAPLTVPIVNCVDGSDDPVSIYAAASGLIQNINENEAEMSGEFSRGKSRIMVPDSMMSLDKRTGKKTLTDEVFTGINEDPEDVPITIFSPALRDASYLARKMEYLRNCESIIGLRRGLLADVQEQVKTATEITDSAGDYNLTIIDFQQAFRATMTEVCRLCGVFGKMYKVPGSHDLDGESVSIDWGNGVLYDRNQKWEELKDMVSRGLLKPEIAVGWYFDAPTETESDLQAIRTRYMPELREMME